MAKIYSEVKKEEFALVTKTRLYPNKWNKINGV